MGMYPLNATLPRNKGLIKGSWWSTKKTTAGWKSPTPCQRGRNLFNKKYNVNVPLGIIADPSQKHHPQGVQIKGMRKTRTLMWISLFLWKATKYMRTISTVNIIIYIITIFRRVVKDTTLKRKSVTQTILVFLRRVWQFFAPSSYVSIHGRPF